MIFDKETAVVNYLKCVTGLAGIAIFAGSKGALADRIGDQVLKDFASQEAICITVESASSDIGHAGGKVQTPWSWDITIFAGRNYSGDSILTIAERIAYALRPGGTVTTADTPPVTLTAPIASLRIELMDSLSEVVKLKVSATSRDILTGAP